MKSWRNKTIKLSLLVLLLLSSLLLLLLFSRSKIKRLRKQKENSHAQQWQNHKIFFYLTIIYRTIKQKIKIKKIKKKIQKK